ncbi:hypothetical protein U1Q18_011983, partial [Sarracenia purpurea var. burkii]
MVLLHPISLSNSAAAALPCELHPNGPAAALPCPAFQWLCCCLVNYIPIAALPYEL